MNRQEPILGSAAPNMSPKKRCLCRQFPPTVRCTPGYIGCLMTPRHTCPALAATLMLASASACAQPPPAGLAQALELARSTASARAPTGARVLATALPLDARLQLAPCVRTEAHLAPGTPAWGRLRVGLRCTQGTVAWNVFVPVHVQVLAPALATTTALPAGARLAAADLTSTEVDWSAGGPPFMSGINLVGRALTRPVPAGHALRPGDLLARQWFAAGDTVRIRASGAGFDISGDGQALTPGVEGQPARVRTEQGRVLTGVPVGEKRIEVSL